MKKWIKLFLLLASLQVAAQKKGLSYEGSVQSGLLEGETGSAFQLQTVNGVTYKTWSAGIGVGLDYYQSRSIPLFLELRKHFGAAQKAPFVYAGSGYNFPWLKASEKDWGYEKAHGGLYMDAGVGYQIPVLKKSLLFFSAGYSQKAYATYTAYPVMIDIYPSPPAQTYKLDYTLRRLSIKTGLRF
jgi:hypothetical protein